MLSNGWYWSGGGYEAMAYPIAGWEVRCRWEGLPSGRWALRLTVREEDPAPWIPGPAYGLKEVSVRPVIGEHRSWDRPHPSVMEEMSRRVGLHRVRQVISCCRSHTSSTQVSNQYLTDTTDLCYNGFTG